MEKISFIIFILLFCTCIIGFGFTFYFYFKACGNTEHSNSISNGFGFFINLFGDSDNLNEEGIKYRGKFISSLIFTCLVFVVNYLITSIVW
jgi:hypothetical protein